MRKLVRCLALVTAMTTVSVAALSVADAQEKGKKATGKTTGIVEINEGKDGKFRFNVRDNDGKFLAMSGPTGFATKEDAAKALEKLKDALENPKVTSAKKAAGGKEKDKEK
ncbi:MAG TPA: hypothetical protein VM533_18255 [Fimbriiglobus sp.]|nr:hypothetical protein [Fimbriiglobus sp.]